MRPAADDPAPATVLRSKSAGLFEGLVQSPSRRGSRKYNQAACSSQCCLPTQEEPVRLWDLEALLGLRITVAMQVAGSGDPEVSLPRGLVGLKTFAVGPAFGGGTSTLQTRSCSLSTSSSAIKPW
jgi:hypothetical protein